MSDRLAEMFARTRAEGRGYRRPSTMVLHTGELPDEYGRRGAGDTAVCAVVHAYYPDLLPEIVDRLVRCKRLTHAVVTHPLHVPSDALDEQLERLRHRGVNVQLRRLENRGRDVLPMLQVLDLLLATDCNAFVKVHTKKSLQSADGYGERWRRELLDGLLPGEIGNEKIVAFLANAPEVGFIAPAKWVVQTRERDLVAKRLSRIASAIRASSSRSISRRAISLAPARLSIAMRSAFRWLLNSKRV